MGSLTTLFPGRLETIAVEPYAGRDGQGAPSYGTAVNVSAMVFEEEQMMLTGDRVGLLAGGVDVVMTLKLLVEADADYQPIRMDRVTRGGATFIVMSNKPVPDLHAGGNHHHACTCREE